MPSDLEQLIEMGFDAERAQLATSRTGGCKCSGFFLRELTVSSPTTSLIIKSNIFLYILVQGALEWLEANQDKSLDEIKASSTTQPGADPDEPPALKPGEEARSLVCNECGKRFRSQAQAEFHASKTEHVDFAESTEEIAPLTEEEKKAKLEELRQKLAAKKAQRSELDKIDQKRNEVSQNKVDEISDIDWSHFLSDSSRFGHFSFNIELTENFLGNTQKIYEGGTRYQRSAPKERTAERSRKETARKAGGNRSQGTDTSKDRG